MMSGAEYSRQVLTLNVIQNAIVEKEFNSFKPGDRVYVDLVSEYAGQIQTIISNGFEKSNILIENV